MTVASLELSKQLFELSGHTWLGDDEQNHKPEYKAAPYYTLGYLLRKLGDGTDIIYFETETDAAHESGIRVKADTPEDAACKLCIELFKQGILKK